MSEKRTSGRVKRMMIDTRNTREVKDDNEHRYRRATVWCEYAAFFNSAAHCAFKIMETKSQPESLQSTLPKNFDVSQCLPASVDVSGEGQALWPAAPKLMFYWIALEALYKQKNDGQKNNEESLKSFLRLAISINGGDIRETLKANEAQARKLVDLQVTCKEFWNGPSADTKEELLNNAFLRSIKESAYTRKILSELKASKRIASSVDRAMIKKGWRKFFEKKRIDGHRAIDAALSQTDGDSLNDGLMVVLDRIQGTRHTVVHGGSSGDISRGATQLVCASKLLEGFLPLFTAAIRETSDNPDWGIPPFPRRGKMRDDDNIFPPWLD